jgi:hypothetical protein
MKFAMAVFAALLFAGVVHADSVTVPSPCGNPVCPLPSEVNTGYFYVNAFYQWQDFTSGTEMEEFMVNWGTGPGGTGPIMDVAWVYGPVADFPAMDVLDPAQFPAGPGQSAPEPASYALLLVGMAGLLVLRRYRMGAEHAEG